LRAIVLSDMSTAEMLFEKAGHLPENLQAEALNHADFLLTSQYSPADAVHDEEPTP